MASGFLTFGALLVDFGMMGSGVPPPPQLLAGLRLPSPSHGGNPEKSNAQNPHNLAPHEEQATTMIFL